MEWAGDFSHWVQQITNFALLNHLSESQLIRLYLLGALEGKALKYWQNLQSPPQKFLDSLILLWQQFGAAQNVISAVTNFETVKMKNSVKGYCQEFERCLSQIPDGYYTPTSLFRRLLGGLTVEYQRKLLKKLEKSKEIHSLESLITFLIIEEETEKSVANLAKSFGTPENKTTTTVSNFQTTKNTQQKPYPPRGRDFSRGRGYQNKRSNSVGWKPYLGNPSPYQSSPPAYATNTPVSSPKPPPKRSFTPRNNNKQQHLERSANNANNNQKPKRSNSTNRYVPTCYKCGKLGHIEKNCYSSVAHPSSQNQNNNKGGKPKPKPKPPPKNSRKTFIHNVEVDNPEMDYEDEQENELEE